MVYTDYQFYKETYKGYTVDESLFDRYLPRASAKLSYLCMGNITEETLEKYNTQVQNATCCVIDILYKLDDAQSKINDPKSGSIKSMSSGGRSITFGNNDTVYTNALGDKQKQDELILDEIREYLYGTDLLYAGVD